mmetsp:Transcript_158900/g.509654  ORF Transcript_158900/g.509654 Transcript_158900/m.509654 type:complete len:280 (+) Transcript_158900:588-1427(+)
MTSCSWTTQADTRRSLPTACMVLRSMPSKRCLPTGRRGRSRGCCTLGRNSGSSMRLCWRPSVWLSVVAVSLLRESSTKSRQLTRRTTRTQGLRSRPHDERQWVATCPATPSRSKGWTGMATLLLMPMALVKWLPDCQPQPWRRLLATWQLSSGSSRCLSSAPSRCWVCHSRERRATTSARHTGALRCSSIRTRTRVWSHAAKRRSFACRRVVNKPRLICRGWTRGPSMPREAKLVLRRQQLRRALPWTLASSASTPVATCLRASSAPTSAAPATSRIAT